MGNCLGLLTYPEMALYIDLHAHTYPASDDSFISPDDLIDGAKKAGLDGICLTEHDYFWSPHAINALSQRHKFLVLAGAEINTEDGHVLVFGLHEYRFGMHKMTFLRDLVQRCHGAMVAAHPYRRRFPRAQASDPKKVGHALDQASAEEFFSMCHAIEVINGRGSPAENLFSRVLCNHLGLGGTGGSDIHRAEHIGQACTWFHHNIDGLDDLVRELRTGDFTAEARYPSTSAQGTNNAG